MQRQQDSAAGSVCVLRAHGAGGSSAVPGSPRAGTPPASLGTRRGGSQGSPQPVGSVPGRAGREWAGSGQHSPLGFTPPVLAPLIGFKWSQAHPGTPGLAPAQLAGGERSIALAPIGRTIGTGTGWCQRHGVTPGTLRPCGSWRVSPGRHLPRVPRAGAAGVGSGAGRRGSPRPWRAVAHEAPRVRGPHCPATPSRLMSSWEDAGGHGGTPAPRSDAWARGGGEHPGGLQDGGSWQAPPQGSLFMEEPRGASVPAPHLH